VMCLELILYFNHILFWGGWTILEIGSPISDF
jgi:hypothetical protein